MNIDDGDIYMGEYTNGAIGSIQTSYVTIGNYPGIEARLYGRKARSSAGWSRSSASPRRSRWPTRTRSSSSGLEIPERFYPPAARRASRGAPSSTPT